MTAAEPLTITAAEPLIRSGGLTPSELLEQCLRRVDVYEPAVRAWVYLDRERARRDAERLTDEAKRGQVRGPLHGIPVGVKDIIDVFDMPTGCGSTLWANSYARRDATVVERLRQAGAIILGKTVTTPYAYLDPPPTRNPWNLDRTPGGSSSGSAAAVACGMCLAALGTQTGGSLTRPASYCGVCSLKPTYGRVSVDGVLPLAPSLDHVGVMANCVRDLAVVFEVVGGWHEFSTAAPACVAGVDERVMRHTLHRLGGSFDELLSPDLTEQYAAAIDCLGGDQLRIDGLAVPAGFAALPVAHHTLMAVGAAATHGDRPDRHPDDYPPRIRELIDAGRSASGGAVGQAFQLRRSLQAAMDATLMDRSVLLTPAAADVAPDPSSTGRAVFNAPWSFLGLPTVSLPTGSSADGLPFSVQLIGRDEREDWLLATAAWCEDDLAVEHRLPPVPA